MGSTDLLFLPNICRDVGDTHDEAHLTDSMLIIDPFEMLHLSCGHVSKSKLLKGHWHMLFMGSGYHEGISVRSLSSQCLDICVSLVSRQVLRSFHPTDPDTQQASKFLEKVTADIAAYLNCPLREGYKCVFVITDVATKMLWVFLLKTRSGEEGVSSVSRQVGYTWRT